MNFFTTLFHKIREAIGRMIPYKSIEQAEHIETPLTTDMVNAVDKWYAMYIDQAPWVDRDSVHSLNLASFIASEIARQVLLEVKWSITGKTAEGETQGEDGEEVMNPRAEYLKTEFEKLMNGPILRQKLEQGCAAGGMIIKPYPNLETGHIHFDWAMDWGFYPIAFDDDGNLTDFIIPDVFREGKTIYTRLERHTLVKGKRRRKAAGTPQRAEENDSPEKTAEGRTEPQKGATEQARSGNRIRITQRAFKSTYEESLGREISLDEVPRWAGIQPEAEITETDAPLIGWYKVASSNTIDVDSPLGASVYAKAADTIKQADIQYSNILWEYEGSQLAIDVDPTALSPRNDGTGRMVMPNLNKRLFRAVDIQNGEHEMYNIFAPAIRDSSLFYGLNQYLMRVEDLCGLSRGTISDANSEARTATEMKILRNRSYETIADNQTALESCLRDVVKAMDRYATLYNLAPEGEYDVSFEWDDSILTDTDQQTQERLMLLNAGIMSKAEFREWYFGETAAQAQAAIEAVAQEKADSLMEMQEMMPSLKDGSSQGDGGGQNAAGGPQDGDGGNGAPDDGAGAQNAP